MIRFKQIISKHRVAVGLAFLTSIIVALPQIYFRIDHKEFYKDGVQVIEMIPDSPWTPRVSEVQDGHPNFGGIYYKDGKSDPYLFQPLGSMVVGYMGKILFLDSNNTILFSRLVLTFIAFILIYMFSFLLIRDKFISLAGTSILLLVDSILSYSNILGIFRGVSPNGFLPITMPINPAMIYILLFGFLITFWLFYKKQGNKTLWWFLSTVLLGSNFYNYFYSWTYLYAFGGILVLLFLIQKKWREAIRIASVFFGALIVAIPYIINLYSATLYSSYEEVSMRFGVVESYAPLFVGITVIGAIIIFLFGFPREEKQRYFFSLALLLSPFVTMNQQLLTGKIMQAAHYHWYFHRPIAIIFVFITVFYISNRYGLSHYKKIFTSLVIVVSFLIGLFIQINSYYTNLHYGTNTTVERQKYGPVMDWLNKNAKKESVVFSNNEISHLTVIYTSLNVFYHRAAMYSLSATKERLLDTIFSFYRLRGVTSDNVDDIFSQEEREYISSNIYGMYYRETLGSYEAIPDEKIKEIVESYKKTLLVSSSEWLRIIWNHYEVEYIVWDKKVDPLWQLEQYSFLEESAVFGDIAIYKFSPNNQ